MHFRYYNFLIPLFSTVIHRNLKDVYGYLQLDQFHVKISSVTYLQFKLLKVESESF